MLTEKYVFKVDELGTGRFIDYETIPYKIDTAVDNGDLIIVPLNHDWKAEPAHITTIDPIRITVSFLLANKWRRFPETKDLTGQVIPEDVRLQLEENNIKIVLYPRSGLLYINHGKWPECILYIHQLQNVMVAAGLSIREMTFLPEFYEARNKKEHPI